MKNYLSTLKRMTLLGAFLVSAWWNGAIAQNCTISGPNEGCAGTPATFSVAAGAGDVVSWTTTAGLSSNTATTSFTFTTPGTVTITVTITQPGGSSCTQDLVFTVNAVPTAKYTLLSAPFQCYSGNMFCYQDASTPGQGRTLTTVEFLFGDGGQDFTTGPGGTYCHAYPANAGGYYSPSIRVFNDKGCVSDYIVPNNIYVTQDIGADFATSGSLSCGTSTYPIQNNSTVPYNRVKSYFWDFGDGETYQSGVNGSAIDSCYWNPTHVYSKHGCFDVTLIVQDDSNCWDTMFKPGFACNVNPNLVIDESNGKDAQCQTGNSFTFTHNIDPLNWPVSFLWVFDDPNSGPLNVNNRNFKGAQHNFTAPDVYTVTIQGTIAGCPFFSSIDVLTKGPAATIDSKGIPDIIADSLRHQCQIKDTVYFKNNSAYAFNDIYILDEDGGASVLKQDSMVLLKATRSVRAFENVIDIYIWGTDTMAVVEKPLAVPAHSSLIMHDLVMFNNFFGAWGAERQDDHTTTLWDFGDQTAPQCTTWTKYMLNVWDADGKWMNCNYSRDPKPKHWYTPGKEGCFTVKLTIKDTTYQQPGQGYNYWDVYAFNPTTNGYGFVTSIIDTVLYNDFLRDSLPDPSRVRYEQGGVWNDTARFLGYYTLDSLFDYPALIVNGDTDWIYSTWCPAEKVDYRRVNDPTKKFFTEFDTTYNKWYINPNHLIGEDCESEGTVLLALEPPNASGMKVKPYKSVFCLGTNPSYGVTFDWSETTPSCTRQYVWMNFDSLLDRLDGTPGVLDKWTPQIGFLLNPITPWPMGTLNMPQFPNEIYYDYTNRLADTCGRITVGLRVQNGYDPYTKQPCIDEKWYHNMLNYVYSDPAITIDSVYGCMPFEVEVTFEHEFHDSLTSMNLSANRETPPVLGSTDPGFYYVDSVYRNVYDPRTQDTINYVLTFYTENWSGKTTKVDSFPWTASVGGVEGCGSELKIKRKRKMTFREPGRYYIIASSNTTDGCLNGSTAQYLVVGFTSKIEQDKYLICKDEAVEFKDDTKYLRLYPDPFNPGSPNLVDWNFWRDNNRFLYDDKVTPRTPAPFHETVNWDFGQGIGFTTIRFDPKIVTYNVPGHYKVEAEYIDSMGCRDTLRSYVDVTGGKANFNFTINIGNCKPIVNFVDSSLCYDPCRLLYNNPCDSVIRWIWDFGDGSPIINTTSYNPVAPPIVNPSWQYNKFGDYDVTLIIETAMGCWDTLTRTVSVAGPRPRFDFTIDSIGCAPYTVYLGNYSIDPGDSSIWTYYWGDPGQNQTTTKEDTVVYFTYDTPGTYNLRLVQEDVVPLTGERCVDSFPSPNVVQVTVLPPKPVDFIASKIEVCPNEIITFTDTSDSTYTTFIWDFDDGTVLTRDRDSGRVVQHSYANVGTYIVRLNPDYTPLPGEPKCRQSKSVKIIVKDVNANFSVDTTQMPLFTFTNTSTNAKEYWWRFGDGDDFTPCPQVDPVNCPNAQHNYGDKVGSFDVCLVVLSPEGCYDTACATVINTFEVKINIPNVFTPNGDDKNDEFVVEAENWVKYEIKIYNRFSEKVFESNDPAISWNGKKDNSGAELPAGVYYVVINYQLRGMPEETYNGTVTLIR